MISQLNNPNEWSYFSEGGKNAVFAYHNSMISYKGFDDAINITKVSTVHLEHHEASTNYNGYILRVSKKDLAMSSLYYQIDSQNEIDEMNILISETKVTANSNNNIQNERINANNGIAVDDIHHRRKVIQTNISYQQKVIRPKLGKQYLDIPKPVQYSYRFLAILRYRTMNENRIPASRLKDWSPLKKWKDDEANIDNRMCFGALFRNYTLLQSARENIHHVMNEEQIEKRTHHSIVDSCISIEIKPKAGYISSSPLVKPIHRHAKYTKCRFEIMQRLIEQGSITKGWMNQPLENKKNEINHTNVSSFSPLEFFQKYDNIDDEEKSIQNSLSELFRCPQNNLRLWWNPESYSTKNVKPIFGQNSNLSEEVTLHILDKFINNHVTFDDDCNLTSTETLKKIENKSLEMNRKLLFHNLKHIITKILLQESSLRRNILMMQKKYDIIDADGANEVYKRLLNLCNGSNELAQLYINDHEFWMHQNKNDAMFDDEIEMNIDYRESTTSHATGNDDTSKNSFDVEEDDSLLFYNEYAEFPENPPKCKILSKLLKEIQEFRKNMNAMYKHSNNAFTKYDIENEDWINQVHSKTMNYVHQLNKDACVWLLQNWLLSLTMCDVSIFITLAPLTKHLNIFSEKISSPKPQTDSSNGYIYVKTIRINNRYPPSTLDTDHSWFSYTVKVVDCDPKPAEKLESREKSEAIIAKYNDYITHKE